MITTASSSVRADFRTNPLQQVLFAAYIAVWIWAAVDPVYRFDWLLENLLTFLAVPLLVWSYTPAFPCRTRPMS